MSGFAESIDNFSAEGHATRGLRIVILSFLFNWPSRGGGNMHTIGLGQALEKEGHRVTHVYARHAAHELGNCDSKSPIDSKALEFSATDWRPEIIKQRFRDAVVSVTPDIVLITDAWNFKPLLAEAVDGYRYILRFDAMECICPLNNIRLLPTGTGFRQCYRSQLSTPAECRSCVHEFGKHSGSLHVMERDLSEVSGPAYHDRLLRSLQGAWCVLAVNAPIATLLEPFTDRVLAIPAGIDAERFCMDDRRNCPSDPAIVLFPGSCDDPIKGFRTLHDACAQLWERRHDFRLLVTADPPGPHHPFITFSGWIEQTEIARLFYKSSVVVIPSVCQEAMPLVAMEAMAAARPVVASRIGGLPFCVVEGSTGLLFEPGDADNLAFQLEVLLNNPSRRCQMGLEGRRRFDKYFSWDAVVSRHYRPLLQQL